MNDAFRYWQGKKIEHAGSVSNLTLTLAIGAIAFGLTMLEKKASVFAGCWSPIIFIASLFLLLLSAAFAFMGMASRLEDFAASAQAARLRDGEDRDEARLAEERAVARYAGKRTKAYLTCQLISFILGVAFLASAVVVANVP